MQQPSPEPGDRSANKENIQFNSFGGEFSFTTTILLKTISAFFLKFNLPMSSHDH